MALPNITYTKSYISDGQNASLSLKNFYETLLVGDINNENYYYPIPISDFFIKYRDELATCIEYYALPQRMFYQPKTLSYELYGTTELWLALLRVNEMRNIAYKITNEDNLHEFKQMVGYLVQIFVFDMHNSVEKIKSRDYLTTMLEVYKKTNNNDANLVGMRKILDNWLVETGLAKRITRPATLNSFKKAMYLFTALTIQDNM